MVCAGPGGVVRRARVGYCPSFLPPSCCPPLPRCLVGLGPEAAVDMLRIDQKGVGPWLLRGRRQARRRRLLRWWCCCRSRAPARLGDCCGIGDDASVARRRQLLNPPAGPAGMWSDWPRLLLLTPLGQRSDEGRPVCVVWDGARVGQWVVEWGKQHTRVIRGACMERKRLQARSLLLLCVAGRCCCGGRKPPSSSKPTWIMKRAIQPAFAKKGRRAAVCALGTAALQPMPCAHALGAAERRKARGPLNQKGRES